MQVFWTRNTQPVICSNQPKDVNTGQEKGVEITCQDSKPESNPSSRRTTLTLPRADPWWPDKASLHLSLKGSALWHYHTGDKASDLK